MYNNYYIYKNVGRSTGTISISISINIKVHRVQGAH